MERVSQLFWQFILDKREAGDFEDALFVWKIVARSGGEWETRESREKKQGGGERGIEKQEIEGQEIEELACN